MRLSHSLVDIDYVAAKPLNSPGILWRERDSDLTLLPNECHIWAIQLDQSGECVQRLARYLSPPEAKQANRFYSEQDKGRYTVGRSLLKILISAYTGIEPGQIELQTSEAGKPYLPKNILQFSKTASGPFGLIAVTWRIDVGIDVEKTQNLDELSQLSKSFFSSNELVVFQKASPPAKAQMFYNGWTRKEALLKALGIGLTLAPDQIAVSLDTSPVYEFNIPSTPTELPANWTLKSWSPAAGYQAAIAIRSSNVALSFYKL